MWVKETLTSVRWYMRSWNEYRRARSWLSVIFSGCHCWYQKLTLLPPHFLSVLLLSNTFSFAIGTCNERQASHGSNFVYVYAELPLKYEPGLWNVFNTKISVTVVGFLQITACHSFCSFRNWRAASWRALVPSCLFSLQEEMSQLIGSQTAC